MIHLDWSISIGQIVLFFTLVGGIYKVNRMLDFFAIEHEILMVDYAKRNNIKLRDLPTRSKASS